MSVSVVCRSPQPFGLLHPGLHAKVPTRRGRCVAFIVKRVRQGVLEFISGVENRARAARRGGEQARLVQPDVVAASKNGS